MSRFFLNVQQFVWSTFKDGAFFILFHSRFYRTALKIKMKYIFIICYVYYLDDCLAYKSTKGVFAIIFVLIHLDHVFMKYECNTECQAVNKPILMEPTFE